MIDRYDYPLDIIFFDDLVRISFVLRVSINYQTFEIIMAVYNVLLQKLGYGFGIRITQNSNFWLSKKLIFSNHQILFATVWRYMDNIQSNLSP